jgi:ribonuclease HI
MAVWFLFKYNDNNYIMDKFIAYTDGSCDNLDPKRPGGAAYIIFNEDMTLFRKASKGFCGTTNNRMELLAIISVVNALPKGSEVTIYTDSQYCITTLKAKKPKMNLDLVGKYHQIAGKLAKVTFEWVKGHAGDKYNEMCDSIAVEESVLRGGQQNS